MAWSFKQILGFGAGILAIVFVAWLWVPNDDVNEAVLRYLARDKTREKSLAFVSINGVDPSPRFIQRFASGVPEILPASRGVSDNNPDGWMRRTLDSQTQRPGTLIQLHRVTWAGINLASVEVDLPGSGSKYFLQKQNAIWRVVNREGTWIE